MGHRVQVLKKKGADVELHPKLTQIYLELQPVIPPEKPAAVGETTGQFRMLIYTTHIEQGRCLTRWRKEEDTTMQLIWFLILQRMSNPRQSSGCRQFL